MHLPKDHHLYGCVEVAIVPSHDLRALDGRGDYAPVVGRQSLGLRNRSGTERQERSGKQHR